jgi:hypothetical protein
VEWEIHFLVQVKKIHRKKVQKVIHQGMLKFFGKFLKNILILDGEKIRIILSFYHQFFL